MLSFNGIDSQKIERRLIKSCLRYESRCCIKSLRFFFGFLCGSLSFSGFSLCNNDLRTYTGITEMAPRAIEGFQYIL